MTYLVSCNSDSLNKSFRVCLSRAASEASTTGQDFIARFGPHEWFRFGIGGVDEVLNRTLQLLDTPMDAAPNLLLGQFSKPAFYLVQP